MGRHGGHGKPLIRTHRLVSRKTGTLLTGVFVGALFAKELLSFEKDDK